MLCPSEYSICVFFEEQFYSKYVLQVFLEPSVTTHSNTVLENSILGIPDEMVFNKETDCSVHCLIEGILNNACKSLKNVEHGNIRYMYCLKKKSVNVNQSCIFLCALHHCSHILGVKLDLEQKLCLSSYKLCISSRAVDHFLKKNNNQRKI